MRVGLPFSIALHLGLAAAGMIVIPTMTDIEPTPMVILPVELLEIADSTNVAPIAEAPKPDAAPEQETAPASTPAPAAAPEPEEAIPDIAPPPPKKEEPKQVAKAEPKPPAPKKESFEDSLDSILKTVDKNKSKAPPAETRTATNLRNVEDAAARRGVGDKTRNTITVADFIVQQMLRKGCWSDQDDMPDAKRLRAVIRVKFGRDGRFVGQPELREPTRIGIGDKPMEVFVARAHAGLNKCNQLGFEVPAQYYETQPPQWIDIVFLP